MNVARASGHPTDELERPVEIFLSFRTLDIDAVRAIKARLVEHTPYNLYFFEERNDARRSFPERAGIALAQSRCLIAFLGESGAGMDDAWQYGGALREGAGSVMQVELAHAIERNGGWEEMERQLASGGQPQLRYPVIPVLLPNTRHKGLGAHIEGWPSFFGKIGGIEIQSLDALAIDDAVRKLAAALSASHISAPPKDWEIAHARKERATVDLPYQNHPLADFMRRSLSAARIALEGQGDSGCFARGSAANEPVFINQNGVAQARDVANARTFPLSAWLGPNGPRNILLTGPPGSGKSSFLWLLRRTAASLVIDPRPSNAEDQDVAEALARRAARDGPAIPIFISARELAGRMQFDPGAHPADLTQSIVEVLAQELPKAARGAFPQRLDEHPYLLLVDALDGAPSDLKTMIEALGHLATAHPKVRIVVSARHGVVQSATLTSLLRVGREEQPQWESISIQPLPPDRVGEFCRLVTNASITSAPTTALAAALGRLVDRAHSDSLFATPLNLAISAFLADAGRKEEFASDDGILLYRACLLLLQDFRSTDARQAASRQREPNPNMRKAVGALACGLLRTRSRAANRADFRRWVRKAHPEIDDAACDGLFDDMINGVSGIVVADADPLSDEEPPCRFLHDHFRDAMAADHLASIWQGPSKEAFIEPGGVWEDFRDRAVVWGEAIRLLMAALAIKKNEHAPAFLLRLANELPVEASLSAESLKLLAEVSNLYATMLEPDGRRRLSAKLRQSYASFQGEFSSTKDREDVFSTTALLSAGGEVFPHDIDSAAPITLEGSAGRLVVARSPVRVRAYARFLEAMATADDVRRVLTDEVREAAEAIVKTVRDSAADGMTLRDLFIDRRARLSWEEQKRANLARPVVDVNWIEAQAYCGWLRQSLQARGETIEGLTPDEHATIRLPTIAEWTAIARFQAGAGADGAGDDSYPWGIEKPAPGASASVNTLAAALGHPSAVGMFRAHPRSGLYDFGSNIMEWGLPDDLDPDDRRAPTLGASFKSTGGRMKISQRRRKNIEDSNSDVGFRWIAGEAQ